MFFEVRWTGPFAPIFWLMVFCNVVVPQIFWWKRFRTNLLVTWVASLLINVGMWCERFNIIVTSLHRDFLPASWGTYAPTWVDICLFTGTIGLFSTLFLLFLKFVPAVAVQEIKELRHETRARGPRRQRPHGRRTDERTLSAHTERGHGDGLRPPALRAGRVPHRRGPAGGDPQDAGEGLEGPGHPHPYPVHGIEAALGLGRPKIPKIVLAGGADRRGCSPTR